MSVIYRSTLAVVLSIGVVASAYVIVCATMCANICVFWEIISVWFAMLVPRVLRNGEYGPRRGVNICWYCSPLFGCFQFFFSMMVTISNCVSILQ